MRQHKQSTGTYPMYWTFPTDEILHEASQDKVYRAIAKDLAKKYLILKIMDIKVKSERYSEYLISETIL